MSDGFVTEVDDYGQPSATCGCCKSWRLICVRCRSTSAPANYRLEPPYGSNDSRADIRLCDACYRDVVNVVRRSIGVPEWRTE